MCVKYLKLEGGHERERKTVMRARREGGLEHMRQENRVGTVEKKDRNQLEGGRSQGENSRGGR